LPDTIGAFGVPYRTSLRAVSTNARFSSTTTISRSPAANERTMPGSSGCTIPSLSSRIPRRRRSVSSRPSRRSAWRTSSQVLPAATIPIVSSELRTTISLIGLTAA
jgi:hypothetical protein